LTTNPEPAQRIIFPAPGQVVLENQALPQPAPGQVLVRTLYSLMSIGTETTILHGRYAPDSHFANMFSFPQLQTGVQSVGVVEAAGAGVMEFKRGDLVYMRMGHGSHQVIKAADCSPVPNGVDLKQACWAGLAKTAFRAAWAGGFAEGIEVLIIGAGPVGQMLTRWAAALGCSGISVADLSERRLAHALAGGATELVHGDLQEHAASRADQQGYPLVIDCTGNPAVFRPALAAAATFGKVILLGDTGFPRQQCLSSDLMTKGLTLQATHDSHDLDGWTQRRVDTLFFEKLIENRFPLEGLITHEFYPYECARAYEMADRQRHETMGILFDWTDTEHRITDDR
jgi:2-desacetyl-2-hydroxyethyl bacteriochlorophyllide A dehydrogenase